MQKIGIMGGSFDPIHNAHIAMGRAARERFGLDNVLYIPNAHTYYKKDHEMVSDEMRCDMVRLAIKPYPYMGISLIELLRGGITYTIDTVTELYDTYPDSEIYFIIGGDSLVNLRTWRRADELLEKVIFLTVTRGDIDSEKTALLINEYKNDFPYSDIRQLPMEPMDISSSNIRKMLKAGEDVSEMIPPDVLSFIQKKGLYLREN
ncbi:MAG: nicotinate-nucleotide adenylyltransferase [Eubacterium sp.]|nr:nicotinate-nucleotide adenylyltransferase [Eubacterium sp.]